MRRRRPRYALSAIKAAFAEPSRINRIMTAAEGAEDINFDEQAVVDVIASLTPGDFDKSMLSKINPNLWQDVYKPLVRGREIYLKFTLDARALYF